MTNDLSKQAKQRAQRNWYTDGISELVFGGLCLLLGAYFWAQNSLKQESLLASLLSISLVLIVIGGTLLGRYLIHWLKERLTYARTGYISFQSPSKKRNVLTGLVALFLAMLVSALFARAPASLEWIPAVSGLFFGAAWLFFGHRVGLARFYVLAIVSPLIGIASSLASLGEDIGLAAFYALLGVAIMISGGFTLFKYLRQYQQMDAGEDSEGVE